MIRTVVFSEEIQKMEFENETYLLVPFKAFDPLKGVRREIVAIRNKEDKLFIKFEEFNVVLNIKKNETHTIDVTGWTQDFTVRYSKNNLELGFTRKDVRVEINFNFSTPFLNIKLKNQYENEWKTVQILLDDA